MQKEKAESLVQVLYRGLPSGWTSLLELVMGFRDIRLTAQPLDSKVGPYLYGDGGWWMHINNP
jgi:hypothetical protein